MLPDVADADARVKVYQELYADEDQRSRGFVAMRIEWPAQSREVNGPIGDNEDDGDDEDDDADSVLTFSISSLARPSSSSSPFSEEDELIGCDQLEFQPVQEDELNGCNSTILRNRGAGLASSTLAVDSIQRCPGALLLQPAHWSIAMEATYWLKAFA